MTALRFQSGGDIRSAQPAFGTTTVQLTQWKRVHDCIRKTCTCVLSIKTLFYLLRLKLSLVHLFIYLFIQYNTYSCHIWLSSSKSTQTSHGIDRCLILNAKSTMGVSYIRAKSFFSHTTCQNLKQHKKLSLKYKSLVNQIKM